jgi:hypothetical protein
MLFPWYSPLFGLLDIELVAVLVLLHAQEFLAALVAPGRNILQSTVIIGKDFKYLPLFKARQFLPRFQEVERAHAADKVESVIRFLFFQEFHVVHPIQKMDPFSISKYNILF